MGRRALTRYSRAQMRVVMLIARKMHIIATRVVESYSMPQIVVMEIDISIP
jgi:hypothetical protein